MTKPKTQRVTVATLARALVALTEEGYGDCPVFLETVRDVGPLRAIMFRRRNSTVFLAEELDWQLDRATVVDLLKSLAGS